MLRNFAKEIDEIKNKKLNIVTFPMKHHSVWYLDSGATEHMTPYLNKMENFKKMFSKVQTSNKEKIQAEGKGDITVEFSDKNAGLHAVLKDVLYVPNIDGNLLSVGRLIEKGLKITFENNEASVTNSSGEVILKAFRKNRLYEIEEQTQLGKLMKGDSTLWHRRFGHFDGGNLTNVRKFYEESCPACIMGRMKSRPFCNCSTRSKRPLELIHTDIVGIIEPTSQGGSNYFVSFIDDYSRYTVVFPMKYCDDVLFKFDEYRKIAEHLHGLRIKSIKTSSDVEYLNKEFDEYLIIHNIRRKFIVSGMPQRNSVAKSMNQRILNMTKCIISESGIPKNLWADALVTACYLINKCPSSSIDGRIPEALWTKKKVLIQHLRVFGCRSWITLNPTIKNGNLDFKAIECVFIGYSGDTNGYKLWDRNHNSFYISKDVKFDENVFPCKKEHVEEKVPFERRKSDIMTIRVGFESNERQRRSSNIQTSTDTASTETTICKNEDGANNHEEMKYRSQRQDEDEISVTEEILFMSPINKNVQENSKMNLNYQPNIFDKNKVFPFSNSKQKITNDLKSKN